MKLIYGLLLTCGCLFSLQAQKSFMFDPNYDGEAEFKKIVDVTDYLFEGYIISQKYLQQLPDTTSLNRGSRKYDQYFKETTAVVTRVFLGTNIQFGDTIQYVEKLTHERGSRKVDIGTLKPFYYGDDIRHLFFCSLLKIKLSTTSARLKLLDKVEFKKPIISDWITTGLSMYLTRGTAKSFYDLLRKYPTLQIPNDVEKPNEKLPLTNEEKSRTKIFNDSLQKILEKQQQDDGGRGSIKRKRGLKSSGNVDVEYYLGDAESYLEGGETLTSVKVFVATSSPVYLKNSLISIQFDTDVFGFSAESPTESDLQWEFLPVANLYDVSVIGQNVDKYTFLTALNQNSSVDKILLDSNPRALFRVIFQKKNCVTETDFSILDRAEIIASGIDENNFTNFNSYYSELTDITSHPFNNFATPDRDAFFRKTVTAEVCDYPAPTIDVANSDLTVVPGSGKVYTIRGEGFRNERTGNFFISTVEDFFDGSSSPESELDDIDFKVIDTDGDGIDDAEYWTNTEIRFKFPQTILDGNFNPEATPYAGPFKIELQNGSVEGNFNIDYTQQATYDNTTGQKFAYAVDRSSFSNEGIQFRIDSSLDGYPEVRDLIAQALDDWSCQTGFKLALTDDPNVNNLFVADFLTSDNGTVEVMRTVFDYQTCQGALEGHNSVRKFNGDNAAIKISQDHLQQDRFFFGNRTEDLPANKLDFYHIVLHEVGHLLGLGHVVEPGELMFPTTSAANSVIPAQNRISLNSPTNSAVTDVKYGTLEDSQNMVWGGGNDCHLVDGVGALTASTCDVNAVLAPPRSLIASTLAGVINLQWQPSPGALTYVIERKLTSDPVEAFQEIGRTDYIVYNDNDYPLGFTYYDYRLKALYLNGQSSRYTDIVSVLSDGITGIEDEDVENLDFVIEHPDNNVKITWSFEEYFDFFVVRKEDINTNEVSLDFVQEKEITYLNVSPGSYYEIKVRACMYDENEDLICSKDSYPIRVGVPSNGFLPPRVVERPTYTESPEVSFSWESYYMLPPLYVFTYIIERDTVPTFDAETYTFPVITVGNGPVYFNDPSVAPEQTYYYRLRNLLSDSSWVNVGNVTINMTPPQPQITLHNRGEGDYFLYPTGLPEHFTGFSVEMATSGTAQPVPTQAQQQSIVPQSEPELGWYEIYRLREPNNHIRVRHLFPVPGLTYHFRIRVENNGKFSTYSNVVTMSSETPITPFPAPNLVEVRTRGSRQIWVEWEPADDPVKPHSYQIARCEADEGRGNCVEPFRIIWEQLSSSTTNYVDRRVAPGKTYRYKVRANYR